MFIEFCPGGAIDDIISGYTPLINYYVTIVILLN